MEEREERKDTRDETQMRKKGDRDREETQRGETEVSDRQTN